MLGKGGMLMLVSVQYSTIFHWGTQRIEQRTTLSFSNFCSRYALTFTPQLGSIKNVYLKQK